MVVDGFESIDLAPEQSLEAPEQEQEEGADSGWAKVGRYKRKSRRKKKEPAPAGIHPGGPAVRPRAVLVKVVPADPRIQSAAKPDASISHTSEALSGMQVNIHSSLLQGLLRRPSGLVTHMDLARLLADRCLPFVQVLHMPCQAH